MKEETLAFLLALRSAPFQISFLDAFSKLRKTTISFVILVRPSVHMEQRGSHWADFHEV